VRFTLSQPYAPFLENLTMGILPAHIWSSITADEFLFSDFNVRPVGSGPFRVAKVKRNASGIPDTYELAPFERSTREAAYLSRITVRLYPNKEAARDAFLRGEIEAVHSVNPDELKLSDREAAREAVLSRVFGVFYNQNKAEVLTDASVREALGVAIDRERIVNAVLGGYGTPALGPLPPQNIADAPNAGAGDRIASARALLEAGGWMWNEPEPDEETGAMTAGFWSKKSGKTTTRLSMTLTTASVPELKQVAEMVREDWEGAGVPTTLQFFEQNDLQQNVIRPREYEALLFGEVVGRELDLFAFWHASQRNDPGLNVALYASITVDKLLEEARVEQDPVQRLRLAEKAAEDIASDFPAAFIYVPSFVYVLPERIKGYDVRSISVPSERFANVSSWYVSTERVWKPFAGERTVVSAPSF
jgi:peptide/nickel transport system substrate-binding protein